MTPTSTAIATQVTINDGQPMPGQLDVETEVITYRSEAATKPDPRWQITDARGHWHAYADDGTLPTLEARTRHVDCDGIHAGPVLDDVCEGYDVTDWHCRICDELIEPKRLPDTGEKSMPGRMDWSVLVQPRAEITGEVTVRITSGDRTFFGVAHARTEGMEGGSGGWLRITTRLHGISPLGERRGLGG